MAAVRCLRNDANTFLYTNLARELENTRVERFCEKYIIREVD